MSSLASMPRRVRYVPQMEMAECGAACLAMVLDFHGVAVPLDELRVACGVSRDGSSAASVVRAARRYGLKAAGLKLPPSGLRRLALPAILHWEFNHFVVLERIGRRGARIVDPASGRRTVPWRSLGESYTGIALGFQRGAALTPRVRAPGSITRYLRGLFAERRALGFVLVAALGLELLGLALPSTVQVVVDQVVKPQRQGWLLPVAAALAAALSARAALTWLRSRVMSSLQAALDITLTSEFVAHMLRLPLPFFLRRQVGDLMQRVDASDELRRLVTQLGVAAFDLLALATYAVLMVLYDATLGTLALGLSLVRAALAHRARGRLREQAACAIALEGREHGALVEALSAPETVRAAGAEPVLLRRYSAQQRARLNADVATRAASAAMLAWLTLLDGASLAVLVYLGGTRVLSGPLTLGLFAGFLTLHGLMSRPLEAVFQCVDALVHAQLIFARVDDVLEAEPERRGALTLAHARGALAFEDVTFRHAPGAPPLLEGVSFRVAPGERVAIVGRSGQGKSSLFKLLLGMLTPESGRITLDGLDVASLSRAAIARSVGVVPQEPFLTSDTVANNLRLRVPEAAHHELVLAAQRAGAHALTEALPHGYATRVGRGGRPLSGGQRQRLAIARALVGEPPILLLDEATSALDAESEAHVQASLAQLPATCLTIAHRLATVADADRILVLDAGRIVQEGRYAELAAERGLFRELVEAQCA
jgi:ATP-binding cassette, subfamily B, bacterial